MGDLTFQLTQIGGALAILAAFALLQFHLVSPARAPYLMLNAGGAGVLAVVAFVDRQWGFLLLESVWALISLWALVRLTLARRAARSR